MDNRPIGIFDSGMGGLTVLKEIVKYLPNEKYIYFGDCGRIPYGTKSSDTVVKYTYQNIDFLLSHDVKMIVIACNTASACAYEKAQEKYKIPIVEVVHPGSVAAVKSTKNKKIGVIGTPMTIESKIYEKTIKELDPDMEVYSTHCSMFVPLAEEGWWDNDIALAIAKEYISPLVDKGIDTLVLGCTHYPLLKPTIKKVVGDDVTLITSGYELSNNIKDMLGDGTNNLPAAECSYYTSDSVSKFKELGGMFLGHDVLNAEKVEF